MRPPRLCFMYLSRNQQQERWLNYIPHKTLQESLAEMAKQNGISGKRALAQALVWRMARDRKEGLASKKNNATQDNQKDLDIRLEFATFYPDTFLEDKPKSRSSLPTRKCILRSMFFLGREGCRTRVASELKEERRAEFLF